MKPKDFYAACIDRRLFENAISIDSFGNAQRKMAVIQRLPELLYNPCWIGESSNNDLRINAEFYIGDTKCVISLGFRTGRRGEKIPVTLKKESVRLNVKKTLGVRAVAVKPFQSDNEWKIAYCDKDFLLDKWL